MACFAWLVILILDFLAAAIFVAGLAEVGGVEVASELIDDDTVAFVVTWAVVGLVGPLGIRGPTQPRFIEDKISGLGVLNIYNVARRSVLRMLTGAFRAIRRTRALRLAKALQGAGWSPVTVRGRIEVDLDKELEDAEEQVDARDLLRAQHTASDETSQMSGLLKSLYEQRLYTILRDLKKKRKPQGVDRELGEAALEADLKRLREQIEGLKADEGDFADARNAVLEQGS